jgi:hypothetical protein
MKKVFYIAEILAVMILLLTATLSCSASNLTASLGKEFTLPVGQTAVISGENLTLKFVEMTGDSRCAKGVECIRAGDAKCQMLITFNGSTSDVLFTQQGGGETVQDFLNYYKASFVLEPYPEYGKTIDKSDYKLVMTVTKQ